MSKRVLLKFIYFALSTPAHLVGFFLLYFDVFSFKKKLFECLETIDQNEVDLSASFVSYLSIAEDHRFYLHCGVDHFAILRAIYVRLFKGNIQGASTIEQQFVRVVTGEYERKLMRKIKEQILAVLVSNKRGKEKIAKAYLSIAYYGDNYKNNKIFIKNEVSGCLLNSEYEMISIIARIKYPEPVVKSDIWKRKINNRVRYIQNKARLIALLKD